MEEGQAIFIVHGHDDKTKTEVADFLSELGMKPIILHEQPSRGRTIIEKFEDYSNVDFAVVLITPDDVGYSKGNQSKAKHRARQNVILELGYFLGKLGRQKVCPIYVEGVEIPSDYEGVIYVPFDGEGKWRGVLEAEILAAGKELAPSLVDDRTKWSEPAITRDRIGGESPQMISLDIIDSSGEEAEQRIFQLQDVHDSKYLLRSIKKEFKSINSLVKQKCAEEEDEQLVETLDRYFVRFIRNLIPVWVVAIESDDLKLAQAVIDGLFDMHGKTAQLKFKSPRSMESLWLQKRILFIVYCIGAWAVHESQPKFAKLLLGKGTPFLYAKPDESWYRYVLTELARADQLENQSICSAIADFLEEDSYVMELFEGKDEVIDYLCQFDFLQCAFTLMQTEHYQDCYPSFAAFKEPRTEPMIIRLIESHDDTWLDGLTEEALAGIIAILDTYAGKEFVRFGGWTRGIWHDRRITEFMDRFKDVIQPEQ